MTCFGVCCLDSPLSVGIPIRSNKFEFVPAEAVEQYTRAIQVSPNAGKEENHSDHSVALATLYSNRCAARLQLGDLLKALADAHHAVQLAPAWPKGFFRKGCCLRELGHLQEAREAFVAGQRLEPENRDWDKELEKTDKLLLSEPLCQAKDSHLQIRQQRERERSNNISVQT